MKHRATNKFAAIRDLLFVVWFDASGFVKRRLMVAAVLVTVASGLTALGPVYLKQIVDNFAVAQDGHPDLADHVDRFVDRIPPVTSDFDGIANRFKDQQRERGPPVKSR